MKAQLDIGPLWIQLRLNKMKEKLLRLMFLSSLLLQSIHFIVSWWEQALSILQGWFHPTVKQVTGMFSFPVSNFKDSMWKTASFLTPVTVRVSSLLESGWAWWHLQFYCGSWPMESTWSCSSQQTADLMIPKVLLCQFHRQNSHGLI